MPPIDEQEKIVRYLDKKTSAAQKIIDAKTKQVELLAELKRSIISNAVTHGIFNALRKKTNIDWLPEIPENWLISKVGRHFDIVLGKMLQPNKIN